MVRFGTRAQRSVAALVLSGILFGIPAPASSQAVVDATTVEFVPSPDHGAVDAAGSPLLTSYQMQIYAAGSGTVVSTVSLGKPVPGSDGLIRLNFQQLLPSPLPGGVEYDARVSAVGPGGTTASTVSNRFSYSVPCEPSLSSSGSSVGAAATNGSVTVTAGSGCAWSAATAASWLTVTSGASGSGTAAVTFAVDANTSTSSRTGTLSIAGETFTITQAGTSPCGYSIAPAVRTSPSGGETFSTVVTAGSSCGWTAASNAAWLTITSGAGGSGDGAVTFTVAANTGTAQRSGTLTIAGQTFTVTQPGTPACGYTLSPASRTSPAAGETSSFSVSTMAACAWDASSNRAWLTLNDGAAGTGSGTVRFTVSPNTGTIQRSGTITVGGRSFTVTQPGTPACSYAISPASRTASVSGETMAVAVTAGTSCSWSASSNTAWLTVTAGGSGTGSGTVSVRAASNSSSAQRTGTVTIAGKTFTVTQLAITCNYSVMPGLISVRPGGSSGTISVVTTTGCSWTATGAPAWITLASGNHAGSGTLAYTVGTNMGAERSAVVQVAGKSVSISQDAAALPTPPGNVRLVVPAGPAR